MSVARRIRSVVASRAGGCWATVSRLVRSRVSASAARRSAPFGGAIGRVSGSLVLSWCGGGGTRLVSASMLPIIVVASRPGIVGVSDMMRTVNAAVALSYLALRSDGRSTRARARGGRGRGTRPTHASPRSARRRVRFMVRAAATGCKSRVAAKCCLLPPDSGPP